MVLPVLISLLGGVPLCIPYGLYSGTSLGGTTRGTLEGYPGRVLSNTHLFPTGFILAGVWTTGPKTSRFINECNYACIASLHSGQSFICLHSFVFCGSGSSSFCMMSKTTWKAKILFTLKLFRSHFSPLCT